MKAVSIAEMRSIEDAAMREGWTEERLMEQAGERLAFFLAEYFPAPGKIVAYLGKGHNAGDALVALRFLKNQYGWNVAVRSAFPEEAWAPLTRAKRTELGEVENLSAAPTRFSQNGPLLILDALLGIGANGPLRNPILQFAREINHLRAEGIATVAALDLPSGIDSDSGEIHPGTVMADATFMIGAPKRGLLFEHSANATGALVTVPVDPLPSPSEGDFEIIFPASSPSVFQPRPFNFHKGKAGKVSILAGSKIYSGAAVLAATGALRGGAGLVTLFTPPDATDLIAAKCPPEVIVRPCGDPLEIFNHPSDALVIGCGLKTDEPTFRKKVRDLIERSEIPTVLDAEALNLIPCTALSILRKNHILTPHPGEFKRLAPDLAHTSREEAARLFSDRIPSTLLLKGCRTIVTARGEPLRFNPTGTPAMATGGQGDFLSGVIGALLAIGNPPVSAASAAAWLCGRAAEILMKMPGVSEQSLLPSEMAGHLGAAFNDWAARRR
jgi:hydroxyethylthiazole kinase-like uncharacterized protein yjeF